MNNPQITILISLLGEVKGWLYAIIGVVTTVIVVKHGISYQQGNSSEKSEAIKSIKNTIYMGGGIFALAWFATYVVSKFQL